MELDPGSASHPSHHNHYQSRREDGEGGQERKREGERTYKMRTKAKTLGTERKWEKNQVRNRQTEETDQRLLVGNRVKCLLISMWLVRGNKLFSCFPYLWCVHAFICIYFCTICFFSIPVSLFVFLIIYYPFCFQEVSNSHQGCIKEYKTVILWNIIKNNAINICIFF